MGVVVRPAFCHDPTMQGRLSELRVQGLRTLADIRLPLNGLTVLIGDNSAGKSSLIEAIALLAKMIEPHFVPWMYHSHGGPSTLLRHGCDVLHLGATVRSVEDPELEVDYDLEFKRLGTPLKIGIEISRETLVERRGEASTVLLQRDANQAEFLLDASLRTVEAKPQTSLLSSYTDLTRQPAAELVVGTLANIEVHVLADTLPLWVGYEAGLPTSLRRPDSMEHVHRLELQGTNLASAYLTLKKERSIEHWQETLSLVRLGLGPDVEDVLTRVNKNRDVWLLLKYAPFDRPARSLSDGTLSWLAFVALYRLVSGASVVAFDEPEIHMHPNLLMRVLDLFETMATERPVVLATHSDRLLDGLSDPASTVVLCALNEQCATQLIRPDRTMLEAWLERYRGLGELRTNGLETSVMTVGS